MDLDLTGKLALVTGSTRGIGLATAIGLARMGAGVIVNGRSEAAVAEATAKIKAAVPTAKLESAPIDLATAAGCAAITQRFPAVDILVNSLGIYEPKPFFDIPDEDWTKMFEVNVMSGVRLTRHYLKRMLDAKQWGRVVFVSSESGIFIPKEMVHYGFSKSAQLVIARGAAELTKGTNVTVNSVLPGPTWVEMRPCVWRRAPRPWAPRPTIWPRAPSPSGGRCRCCSATRRRRRSPISSATCARRPPAPPTAPRSAPTAASSPIRSEGRA